MIDYGLPQSRKRLVVLASKLGPIDLEKSDAGQPVRTVHDEIGSLPPLQAGSVDPQDRLHRSSMVSELNLKRLRASKPGGTWRDWDPQLVAKCHQAESGKTYSGVYGRMRWDEPSPTMTTLFYGFGNGRFGHPEQDRALSLREGAMLQSFPRDYDFVEPGKPINMRTVGRMIGNAVPVTLGRVIARSVRRHLAAHPA
jgi:DNA (cytosine-5)-methyltransferase 1